MKGDQGKGPGKKKKQRPKANGKELGARSQRPEARGQRPKSRSSNPEAKGPGPGTWGQGPEARVSGAKGPRARILLRNLGGADVV